MKIHFGNLLHVVSIPQAKIYEMSRRLVVRMDILPHLEMISVQRVGAFGVLYTKLHRIQDLEYVPFETVKDNGKE